MSEGFYRPPGGACAVEVPPGSVLGINYSGMHDTAIAIVAPDGRPLFAVSLERLSRRKQDGRPPAELLAGMPWSRIAKAAISAEADYCRPDDDASRIHPLALAEPEAGDRGHAAAFRAVVDAVPVEREFVAHHVAHAASSFWGSGFERAICLVYDGGMANEHWFGGVYAASVTEGIHALDRFGAPRYANVAHLYSLVTALLGFTPMKHEGKITGLAAYGKATAAARDLLGEWLERPAQVLGAVGWESLYSASVPPRAVVDEALLERLRGRAAGISREDLAAAVQAIAEEHVLGMLGRIRDAGWEREAVCLSGGLFANVKINQRVSAFGQRRIFIAPSMTDDGTALGAALHALSGHRASAFAPPRLEHVYLGPRYSVTPDWLASAGVNIRPLDSARPLAEEIAARLAAGQVVAVFQGAGEFGPRALGNRSILAAADRTEINAQLNARLNRTEFMPFAPIIRAEDAAEYFLIEEGERHACRYMTLTVDCTGRARSECPGIVHVDGTARPQVLEAQDNPLMREILGAYARLTGRLALVNTSFNIHEEPIVCSPEDALRGFFEAGLDCLVLEGYVIDLADNRALEARYLRLKLKDQHEALGAIKTRLPKVEHRLRDAENVILEKQHHAWLAAQRADQAEAALAAVHGSRSWRMTSPLRRLMERLKRPSS